MNIHLNNNQETLEGEKLTITDLLAVKKFTFKMLVIKVNEKVIMKEDYSTTYVSEGDHVLILHLMSGG